jgi:FKBP-type peptidyl-prolyl cis-trans isomerase
MKWVTILLLTFFVLSCKEKSDYEGYSITESGLNYKIHSIGDPNLVVNDSDVVSINLLVYTLSDSLVFKTTKSFQYLLKTDTGLMEFVGLLAKGDSATAILNSGKLGFPLHLKNTQDVRVSISINKIETYARWAFYEKYPELSTDLELEEQVKIQSFLKSYHLDSIQYINDVFIIRQTVGSGDFPQLDQEVELHFEGFTIDGKLLDSTRKRNEPFSYVIGVQDQVFKGFDIGIRHLRKGGKAVIVIPSSKAFGSKGSSTGIVDGYNSLVYFVEILDVVSSK